MLYRSNARADGTRDTLIAEGMSRHRNTVPRRLLYSYADFRLSEEHPMRIVCESFCHEDLDPVNAVSGIHAYGALHHFRPSEPGVEIPILWSCEKRVVGKRWTEPVTCGQHIGHGQR